MLACRDGLIIFRGSLGLGPHPQKIMRDPGARCQDSEQIDFAKPCRLGRFWFIQFRIFAKRGRGESRGEAPIQRGVDTEINAIDQEGEGRCSPENKSPCYERRPGAPRFFGHVFPRKQKAPARNADPNTTAFSGYDSPRKQNPC